MKRARIGFGRGMLARLAREDGFSLIELMAALTIIVFGFLALTSAAGTGARLLAEGKQRQAASEIASRQLEHLRNVPYATLMHPAGLTKSADPESPDYYVQPSGTSYDRTGAGTFIESLVIGAGGLITHVEPFTVGSTLLTSYQYVTWVDDSGVSGTQDYKRITVVVAYNTPISTGRPRQVRVSSLINDGSVALGGAAVGAGAGATPSPSATPTPTPSGSCAGDTAAPTGGITLLSGTGAESGFTASSTVTVSMTPSDPCSPITVAFSNDNVTFGASFTFQATTPTATWQLVAGQGSRSVWARFTDGKGNTRTTGASTITVDSISPSAPGTLSRSLSCPGVNRTATLTWGAATDTNLVGYRVFRSVDNALPYSQVTTVTVLTASDTHVKTADSVRYKIQAYDAAGNPGGDSNVIELTKNQCS